MLLASRVEESQVIAGGQLAARDGVSRSRPRLPYWGFQAGKEGRVTRVAAEENLMQVRSAVDSFFSGATSWPKEA